MNLGDLRAYVILRDRSCVIGKLDRSHICDPGTPEGRLTLGHVREHPGGKRRDEPGWCIAQCARSNEQHDESRLASEVRAYLAGVRAGEGMR